jgi:hypothetical protein
MSMMADHPVLVGCPSDSINICNETADFEWKTEDVADEE